MRRRQLGLGGLVLALAFAGQPTFGSDWKYLLAPYGWISELDGEITDLRVFTANAEADFRDIVGGQQVYFEATKDRWTVLTDVSFLAIGETGEGFPDMNGDVDQLILELGGGYKLSDSFEVLFGGRYIDLAVDVEFRSGFGNFSRRVDNYWIDPFVGGRFVLDLGRRWDFRARGDVGGFGVGSDFTWNLALHWIYRASPLVSVAFGYRVLDIDFDEDVGHPFLPGRRARFRYDVTTLGPQIGIAFHL